MELELHRRRHDLDQTCGDADPPPARFLAPPNAGPDANRREPAGGRHGGPVPPYGGDRHRLETKLAADLRPTLCDRNQLESALINLVLNARDAMPDGGHLLIETANTVFPDSRAEPREPALRHMPGSECVALFVTDTGTGMART